MKKANQLRTAATACILILFATGCKKPFDLEKIVKNESSQSLTFVLNKNYYGVPSDTIVITPGESKPIFLWHVEKTNTKSPRYCGVPELIEVIVSGGKILKKDLTAADSWEVKEYKKKESQICEARITDADLQ
jgi:hypothetical protein